MNLSFIQIDLFVAKWSRLNLGDDALRELERQISADPLKGVVIRGTGGLRKLRFAPPRSGKGKSGSTRVGYAYFLKHDLIYLVTIFDKKQQENLTPADRSVVKAILKTISDFHDP